MNSLIERYAITRKAHTPTGRAVPTQTTASPDETGWLGKAARSATQGFGAGLDALHGLGLQALGDQRGAQEQYRQANQNEAQARGFGPDIQSFEDASNAGGGIGNYGSALAYMAVGLVPDMASGLGVGTLAKAAGTRIAAGIARRTAREYGSTLATTAARRAAAAEAAGAGAGAAETAGVGAAETAARAAGTVAGAAETAAGAGTAAAGAVDTGLATAQRRIAARAMQRGMFDRVPNAAAYVGAAAGELPGVTRESVETLQNTDQAGAAKVLVANSVAAALGGAFEGRVLSSAVKRAPDAAQTISAAAGRIAKAIAKDAGSEGTAEAAQTATQIAGHKWAANTLNTWTPDEVDGYMKDVAGAFVAGGLLGGGIGAVRQTSSEATAAAVPYLERLSVRLGEAAERARDRVDVGMERVNQVRAAMSDVGQDAAAFARRAANAPGRAAGAASDTVSEGMSRLAQLKQAAVALAKRRGKKRAGTTAPDATAPDANGPSADALDIPALATPIIDAFMSRQAYPDAVDISTNPVVNRVLSRVNPSSVLWEDGEGMGAAVKAVEKAARGEDLEDSDVDAVLRLARFSDSGVSASDAAAMLYVAAAQGETARIVREADTAVSAVDRDTPEAVDTDANAPTVAQDDAYFAARDDTYDDAAESEDPYDTIDNRSPTSDYSVASTIQTDNPEINLAERLQYPDLDPDTRRALGQELVSKLTGGNVTYTRRKDAEDKFDEQADLPGSIVIGDKVVRAVNLAMRYQSAFGKGEGLKASYLSGLAHLIEHAGADVQAIKPGVVRAASGPLFELTAADIDALKNKRVPNPSRRGSVVQQQQSDKTWRDVERDAVDLELSQQAEKLDYASVDDMFAARVYGKRYGEAQAAFDAYRKLKGRFASDPEGYELFSEYASAKRGDLVSAFPLPEAGELRSDYKKRAAKLRGKPTADDIARARREAVKKLLARRGAATAESLREYANAEQEEAGVDLTAKADNERHMPGKRGAPPSISGGLTNTTDYTPAVSAAVGEFVRRFGLVPGNVASAVISGKRELALELRDASPAIAYNRDDDTSLSAAISAGKAAFGDDVQYTVKDGVVTFGSPKTAKATMSPADAVTVAARSDNNLSTNDGIGKVRVSDKLGDEATNKLRGITRNRRLQDIVDYIADGTGTFFTRDDVVSVLPKRGAVIDADGGVVSATVTMNDGSVFTDVRVSPDIVGFNLRANRGSKNYGTTDAVNPEPNPAPSTDFVAPERYSSVSREAPVRVPYLDALQKGADQARSVFTAKAKELRRVMASITKNDVPSADVVAEMDRAESLTGQELAEYGKTKVGDAALKAVKARKIIREAAAKHAKAKTKAAEDYTRTVEKNRSKLIEGKDTDERAADVGRAIGRTVIAAQYSGTLENTESHLRALRALKDDAVAIDYLNRARRGEFVSSSVSEVPWDDDAIQSEYDAVENEHNRKLFVTAASDVSKLLDGDGKEDPTDPDVLRGYLTAAPPFNNAARVNEFIAAKNKLLALARTSSIYSVRETAREYDDSTLSRAHSGSGDKVSESTRIARAVAMRWADKTTVEAFTARLRSLRAAQAQARARARDENTANVSEPKKQSYDPRRATSPRRSTHAKRMADKQRAEIPAKRAAAVNQRNDSKLSRFLTSVTAMFDSDGRVVGSAKDAVSSAALNAVRGMPFGALFTSAAIDMTFAPTTPQYAVAHAALNVAIETHYRASMTALTRSAMADRQAYTAANDLADEMHRTAGIDTRRAHNSVIQDAANRITALVYHDTVMRGNQRAAETSGRNAKNKPDAIDRLVAVIKKPTPWLSDELRKKAPPDASPRVNAERLLERFDGTIESDEARDTLDSDVPMSVMSKTMSRLVAQIEAQQKGTLSNEVAAIDGMIAESSASIREAAALLASAKDAAPSSTKQLLADALDMYDSVLTHADADADARQAAVLLRQAGGKPERVAQRREDIKSALDAERSADKRRYDYVDAVRKVARAVIAKEKRTIKALNARKTGLGTPVTKLQERVERLRETAQRARKKSSDSLDPVGERGREGRANAEKLTSLLGALVSKLGLAGIRLEVRTKDEHAGLGSATYKERVIAIRSDLTQSEAVAVLMHELGHFVMRDLFASADAATREAVLRGYAAWREKTANGTMADALSARQMPIGRHVDPDATDADMAAHGWTPEYARSFDEYMADMIGRALLERADTKSLIGKFFAAVAAALRTLAQAVDPKFVESDKAVKAWVDSLVDRNVAAVHDAVGTVLPPNKAADAVAGATAAAATDTIGWVVHPQKRGETTKSFDAVQAALHALLTAEQIAVLARAADSSSVRSLILQTSGMSTAVFDDPVNGAMVRATALVVMHNAGELTTTRDDGKTTSLLTDISDKLALIAGHATDSTTAERIIEDLVDGTVRKNRGGYSPDAVKDRGKRTRDKLMSDAKWLLRPIYDFFDRLFSSRSAEAFDSGSAAYASIAAKLMVPSNAPGVDTGFFSAQREAEARMTRAYTDILDGLTLDEQKRLVVAMNTMDMTGDEKIDTAVKRLHVFMERAHEYMRAAGMKIGERKLFWPIVFSDDASEGAIRDALNTDRDGVVEAMKKVGYDIGSRPDKRDYAGLSKQAYDDAVESYEQAIDGLITRMVNGAKGLHTEEAAGPIDREAPRFASSQFQLMSFLLERGVGMRALSSVRERDPYVILSRYVSGATRLAEYTRRFGVNGVVGKELVEEVRKELGSEAAERAASMIAVASGQYAVNGSPNIARISPELSRTLNKHSVREGLMTLQAYQNWRHLGLSLLSQFVDPMGIAVRTGGDVGGALHAAFSVLKRSLSKVGRDDLRAMHAMLGTADDASTYRMLSGNFGGGGGKRAEFLNEKLFRLNGVAWFTTATRSMAMITAQRFLIRHATKPTAQSRRYLDELGLSPDVILQVYDAAADKLVLDQQSFTPSERSDDKLSPSEKVRRAIIRFTDQAILRPNPQQTPTYFSDPFLSPLTQYRGFMYAISEQIVGRIAKEMKHGNVNVIFGALSYAPIILAAELLRELIQWGGEGNPRRADWGAYEYTMYAVQRSGLLGLRQDIVQGALNDAKYGSIPGMSSTGPAVGQVADVLDAAANNGDWYKLAEEALPLSSNWKNLID